MFTQCYSMLLSGVISQARKNTYAEMLLLLLLMTFSLLLTRYIILKEMSAISLFLPYFLSSFFLLCSPRTFFSPNKDEHLVPFPSSLPYSDFYSVYIYSVLSSVGKWSNLSSKENSCSSKNQFKSTLHIFTVYIYSALPDVA